MTASGESSPPRDPAPKAGTLPNEPVIRFPKISLESEAVPGALLNFTVDLALEPDRPVEGDMPSVDDAPGWESLSVDVTLLSDVLEFEEGDEQGVILVRRGKRSRTAGFTARLLPEALRKERFTVHAIMFHKGRQSGYGCREFTVSRESLPG